MRILLRLLSPLLALALAVIGVLVALEVVWAWARPASGPVLLPWPAWQATLQDWAWTAGPVRLIAAGLIAAGVLLVALALRAGEREVSLRNLVPEITVSTSAQSLARLVGHQVRELDHVASASVTATPRKVSVQATSGQPADVAAPDITGAVHALLSELPLTDCPEVFVTVRDPTGPV